MLSFQYNPCIGSRIKGVRYLEYEHISIQPLYRFKLTHSVFFSNRKKFQYNPCIGSRFWVYASRTSSSDFNTTLVSVQVQPPPNQSHSGFYFNTTLVSVQVCYVFREVQFALIFQYNPCIGSRYCLRLNSVAPAYFNTTLVSVQVSRQNVCSQTM